MNELIDVMLMCRPDDGPDLDEEVENLSESIGWEKVLSESYLLLSNKKHQKYWYDAACIFCWAATDGVQIPIENNELVARLYWCLSKYDGLGYSDNGDNLVWSTTIALFKISYMSEWQPLSEPAIKELIDEFNQHSS